MQSKPKKMKRTFEKNSSKSAKNVAVAEEKEVERNEHEMDIDDPKVENLNDEPNEENLNDEPNDLKRKKRPGSDRQPPLNMKSNEYYPFNKYAQLINKDEYYAQTYYGDELYRTDDNSGNQVYAYKQTEEGTLKSFPATNNSGAMLAAMQNDGAFEYPDDYDDNSNFENKYLINKDGNEIYPIKRGTRDQEYLYNNKHEPIFAFTNDMIPYYATRIENNQEIEYLPSVGQDEDVIPITLEDGRIKYPLNKTLDKPIYEYDDEDHPIYKSLGNMEYYGKNSIGDEIYGNVKNKEMQIYAKNSETKDCILAKYSNGDEYYAQLNNQMQWYPTNMDTIAEFYARAGNKQICAKINDTMYYAKDQNSDEYYPRVFIKEESVI